MFGIWHNWYCVLCLDLFSTPCSDIQCSKKAPVVPGLKLNFENFYTCFPDMYANNVTLPLRGVDRRNSHQNVIVKMASKPIQSRKRCISEIRSIFWPWRWYAFLILSIQPDHSVNDVRPFSAVYCITVYCRTVSMQQYLKHRCSKLTHLRQSLRACTKIGVKVHYFMHRFRKFVPISSSINMCKQLNCRELLLK